MKQFNVVKYSINPKGGKNIKIKQDLLHVYHKFIVD